ncbi:hypothetical protein, partial [Pantoea sp. GbtcB22]|uniref:hypothetical protein n=1 Tax=Pantoea sp. GbtcB22 TaxID=2824767 RepID=UPI001C2FCE91
PQGLVGTISLQSTLAGLYKNISINGFNAGVTVASAAGAPVTPVFDTVPGSTCEIDGLSIENDSGVGIVNYSTLRGSLQLTSP